MIFGITFSILTFPAVLSFAPQDATRSTPESRLAHVHVTVENAHGDPVGDLTARDFQISDAGKPQEIVFFRRREAITGPTAPLAPGEVSNRSGAIARGTVILFDLLNADETARGSAWDQLVHVLQPMSSTNDLYLYLLGTDGRLVPVRGVEGGADHSSGATVDSKWTGGIKGLLDERMGKAVRANTAGLQHFDRAQLTTQALSQVAIDMARIAGPKNMIWLTDGFPTAWLQGQGDLSSLAAQLRGTLDAMASAGITLFPVQQTMNVGLSPTVKGVPSPTDPATAVLTSLADSTGGRVMPALDIAGAIKAARADLDGGYLLGYSPPLASWDGSFHKLHVTCSRKGVQIRARNGYFASTEPIVTQAGRAIAALVQIPSDAGNIGLRGSVTADAANPELRRFRLILDANDIALPSNGQQFSAHLYMAVSGRLVDGTNESPTIVSLTRRYNAEQAERILKDGIEIVQPIKLGPKVKSLRFAFYDTALGSAGSVTIPLSQ